jgi:hypothetical protein
MPGTPWSPQPCAPAPHHHTINTLLHAPHQHINTLLPAPYHHINTLLSAPDHHTATCTTPSHTATCTTPSTSTLCCLHHTIHINTLLPAPHHPHQHTATCTTSTHCHQNKAVLHSTTASLTRAPKQLRLTIADWQGFTPWIVGDH